MAAAPNSIPCQRPSFQKRPFLSKGLDGLELKGDPFHPEDFCPFRRFCRDEGYAPSGSMSIRNVKSASTSVAS